MPTLRRTDELDGELEKTLWKLEGAGRRVAPHQIIGRFEFVGGPSAIRTSRAAHPGAPRETRRWDWRRERYGGDSR